MLKFLFLLMLFQQPGQRLFNSLGCERLLNKALYSHPEHLFQAFLANENKHLLLIIPSQGLLDILVSVMHSKKSFSPNILALA